MRFYAVVEVLNFLSDGKQMTKIDRMKQSFRQRDMSNSTCSSHQYRVFCIVLIIWFLTFSGRFGQFSNRENSSSVEFKDRDINEFVKITPKLVQSTKPQVYLKPKPLEPSELIKNIMKNKQGCRVVHHKLNR